MWICVWKRGWFDNQRTWRSYWKAALNEHDDDNNDENDQSEELFPFTSCDKIYDETEDLIDQYG